jgi:hypothetical protein
MASSTPDPSALLLDGLCRYPRSPAESPAYRPDWRALQAHHYKELNRKADEGEPGGFHGVPADEDDGLVVALRGYLKYFDSGDRRLNAAFRYAREAEELNGSHGAASRMRAMCVAGAADREIAARMLTDPFNVHVFLALYFDVRPYLSSRDFVSTLVFPFIVPANEPRMKSKERMWLAGAFVLGIHGLDRMLLRPLEANAARIEETNALIRAVLGEDAFTFLLTRHADAFPVYQDYNRYAEMQAAPQNNDPHAQLKAQQFNRALAGVIQTNTTGLAGDHPLQMIVRAGVESGAAPILRSRPARTLRTGGDDAMRGYFDALGASSQARDRVSSNPPRAEWSALDF